jgi:GntR family transcriptional regulator
LTCAYAAGLLDRSVPVPLYHQVKQWIAERITSGELVPGAQLPNEISLCDVFGVSRGVVRQAMAELIKAGMITRRRGCGTFVCEPSVSEGLNGGLMGLADDAVSGGRGPDSEVLALRERLASDGVAGLLGLTVGEPVIELQRLHRLDGEPRLLVTTHLPARLVPGLTEQDLSGTASLCDILRRRYRLRMSSAVQRVEAAVAATREARLLHIRRGDPLLVLRSWGYDETGRTLEYFVACHRGDRSAFEIRLPGGARGLDRQTYRHLASVPAHCRILLGSEPPADLLR